MADAEPQVLWEGRIHMGAKPKRYPDAGYTGVSVELPVTLIDYKEGGSGTYDVTFVIDTENVEFDSARYQGHKVRLFAYERIAGSNGTWGYVPAGEGLLTGERIEITAENPSGRDHYSIRITTDGNIEPDAYEDFLITRVSLRSDSHIGKLGFYMGFDTDD